jgi:hypothetical protein
MAIDGNQFYPFQQSYPKYQISLISPLQTIFHFPYDYYTEGFIGTISQRQQRGDRVKKIADALLQAQHLEVLHVPRAYYLYGLVKMIMKDPTNKIKTIYSQMPLQTGLDIMEFSEAAKRNPRLRDVIRFPPSGSY